MTETLTAPRRVPSEPRDRDKHDFIKYPAVLVFEAVLPGLPQPTIAVVRVSPRRSIRHSAADAVALPALAADHFPFLARINFATDEQLNRTSAEVAVLGLLGELELFLSSFSPCPPLCLELLPFLTPLCLRLFFSFSYPYPFLLSFSIGNSDGGG